MNYPILSADDVAERVDDLRSAHAKYTSDRVRIRQIMNGGSEAIVALLGQRSAAKLNERDLPLVHLMDSGLTRLAQRLGKAPNVKVDPDRDTKKAKTRALKREHILAGLDYQTRLDLSLPYAARWLPGYGFAAWVIVQGKGRNGQPYAKAEVRNSFDVYPGHWGPDNQPENCAIVRLVSKKRLARQYPIYGRRLAQVQGTGVGNRIWSPGQMNWEGRSRDEVLVAEYFDSSGTYLLALDGDVLLDVVPNPLESGPAFVLAKRPHFDELKGQYDHVVGLMAMMAKLNILAYIASEDAVFRETNIIGDLIGEKYERGRFATNFFSQGTGIERPTADVAFQVFTQIDRIERQLRIGSNYSVVQDSESPNSFVTGRGLDKLTDSASANISEYQGAMRSALEQLDSKRLEWEDRLYGPTQKSISANIRGQHIRADYVPSEDIAGYYESRRVYGVMAGWDEPEKIVTGLQLLQAEVLDHETIQENLDGLENLPRVNERIRRRKAEQILYDMLSQRAAEGDPSASMALVDIYDNPDDMDTILKKFFTPQEPELSPEEAAMAQQPGLQEGLPEQPEAVSTVLSRLMGGQAQQGVQTVGRL